jgi:hypothetical protein
VLEAEIDAFINKTRVSRYRRADEVGTRFHNLIIGEFGDKPFFRQLHAIAFDARKTDFSGVPVRLKSAKFS